MDLLLFNVGEKKNINWQKKKKRNWRIKRRMWLNRWSERKEKKSI